MIDVVREIKFKTARSGGSGGQNVNKVETMVEGYFHPGQSQLLTVEQKARLSVQLQHKINAGGFLQVKSQVHRTQLHNKTEVIKKINALLTKALQVKKKRVSTRPSRNAQEKRIESKKKAGITKQTRRKIRNGDA